MYTAQPSALQEDARCALCLDTRPQAGQRDATEDLVLWIAGVSGVERCIGFVAQSTPVALAVT